MARKVWKTWEEHAADGWNFDGQALGSHKLPYGVVVVREHKEAKDFGVFTFGKRNRKGEYTGKVIKRLPSVDRARAYANAVADQS